MAAASSGLMIAADHRIAIRSGSHPSAGLTSSTDVRPVSLTLKQRQLLDYIGSYLATEGIGPSYEEMKEAMGLHSKSGIFRLMSALEERGFLRRLPNRARAIELFDVPRPAVLAAPRPLAKASTDALIAELLARGVEIPSHSLCAAAKCEATASP